MDLASEIINVLESLSNRPALNMTTVDNRPDHHYRRVMNLCMLIVIPIVVALVCERLELLIRRMPGFAFMWDRITRYLDVNRPRRTLPPSPGSTEAGSPAPAKNSPRSSIFSQSSTNTHGDRAVRQRRPMSTGPENYSAYSQRVGKQASLAGSVR